MKYSINIDCWISHLKNSINFIDKLIKTNFIFTWLIFSLEQNAIIECSRQSGSALGFLFVLSSRDTQMICDHGRRIHERFEEKK